MAAARARAAGRTFKIGFVSWQAQSAEDQLKYLHEGLAQFGYVEGRKSGLKPFSPMAIRNGRGRCSAP